MSAQMDVLSPAVTAVTDSVAALKVSNDALIAALAASVANQGGLTAEETADLTNRLSAVVTEVQAMAAASDAAPRA